MKQKVKKRSLCFWKTVAVAMMLVTGLCACSTKETAGNMAEEMQEETLGGNEENSPENTGSEEITMMDIVNMQHRDNIFKYHDSILIERQWLMEDGGKNSNFQYCNEDIWFTHMKEGNFAIYDGTDFFSGEEPGKENLITEAGALGASVYVDEYYNPVNGDASTFAGTEIAEIRYEGDKCYVTTREKDIKAALEVGGYGFLEYTEDMIFESRSVYEKDRMLVLSFQDILIAEDGTETELINGTVTYDTEAPKEVTEVLKNLEETTYQEYTVVENPKTEEEKSQKVRVAESGILYLHLPEDGAGCGVYLDEECTIAVGTTYFRPNPDFPVMYVAPMPENDVDLEALIKANQPKQVLEVYDSVEAEFKAGSEGYTSTLLYVDDACQYLRHDYADGIECLMFAEQKICHYNEKDNSFIVKEHEKEGILEVFPGIFLAEGYLQDYRVTKVEETEENIILNINFSLYATSDSLANVGTEGEMYSYLRGEYVLDKDTGIIQSSKEEIVLKDGTVKPYNSGKYYFNKEMPEEVAEFYQKMQEEQ